jgi:glucosyl-dolichyl phosphate glucuronosyltransferase
MTSKIMNPRESQSKISVIIPTYNRADFLVKALESVIKQKTEDHFYFDIIVVDDGSIDRTRDVIEEMMGKWGDFVRYVKAGGEGIAAARNHGVSAAKAEWIAFMDDDQVAEDGWLINLFETAKKRAAMCVAGKRVLSLPEKIPIPLERRVRAFYGEDFWGSHTRKFKEDEIPHTGNILINKGVFDKVGAFNTNFEFGGEDTEFFIRVKKAGIDIWYTPDAAMVHLIEAKRLSESYLRAKAYREGISWAIINHKHMKIQVKMKECLKWMVLLIKSRLLVLALQESSAGELYHKYIRWFSTGFLAQMLALLAPNLFRNSVFFKSFAFRRVHKGGHSE